MIRKSYVSILLGVAVAVFAILLVLQGVNLEWDYLRPFSAASGAVMIVIIFFEKFVWRLKWLYPWFVRLPNLAGEWEATLTSSYRDPGGSPIPPVAAKVRITQTFGEIHLHLDSAESHSLTLTCSLTENADRSCELSGAYRNTPDVLIRERSQIHHGAFLLHVPPERRPVVVKGEYWTDRNTHGRMELKRA